MSRTARKLKQVEASAENAVKMPQAEPERFALSTSQRLAVESIVAQEQMLEQQQRQLMTNIARTAKDKAALVAEIERAFGLSQGAIGTNYAVINGEVIRQG